MSATTTARATGAALQGGRWGVFGLRYLAYSAYGFLAFIGKPGSRLIVFALACLAAWQWRDWLEFQMVDWAYRLDMHHLPATAYVVAGIVVVCVGVTLSTERARQALALTGGALRFALRLAFVVLAFGLIAYACNVQMPTLADLAAYAPHLDGVNIGPLDVALGLCVIVASCVYMCLSKLMTLLLGAFPVVTRPLRPLKPLKAVTRVIRPARVRIVVPPLPTA
jgi:hypothetical protein